MRGICTGCGESKDVTIAGLVYKHMGSDRRLCPGSSRFPEEAGAAPASVAAVLERLIQDLPVHHLDGDAVVRLADLTAAIDHARAYAARRPPEDGHA